ncbi:uncharacterized protein [Syngnathus scovelli]|uniref:uncharacterized protein isoform X2 n=1 Tax=Syngnathus scovelli TaxID=161590 RepID=UPI00210F8F1E|nr:uncharacterized protein LOC125990325 [Syngnathus scovelli]
MNVSMCSNDIFWLDQLAPFELRPTRAKSQDAFDETSRTPGLCYASPAVQRSGRPAKRARVEDILSGSPVGEMKRHPVQGEEGSREPALLTILPEEPRPTWNGSPRANLRDGASCETTSGTKSGNFSLQPGKAMADVFKYELSRAVSHSVDSLFKSMPLIRAADGSSRGPRQVLDVQTEALSLVVRGPREEASKSLKVPSEAESGSTEVPSVCFPRVKMESSGLLKNHRYSLNEGLTTQHLKKAKLMFFYTRYPSSPVLKMCFHDVQFTRCIGSQLIKWFSNFREFYYIQMEKFARRAVAEGPADAVALSVDRESQLFRALNVHYNKGGDFQVPNGFLEVAEITLRQFYTAISTGKDREPSWKKAIYKVICKLDADVPARFKT